MESILKPDDVVELYSHKTKTEEAPMKIGIFAG